MHSIRCQCGKIVCQVENLPQSPKVEDVPRTVNGPAAVILCRHCKRYVVLRFPSLSAVYTAPDVEHLQQGGSLLAARP